MKEIYRVVNSELRALRKSNKALTAVNSHQSSMLMEMTQSLDRARAEYAALADALISTDAVMPFDFATIYQFHCKGTTNEKTNLLYSVCRSRGSL